MLKRFGKYRHIINYTIFDLRKLITSVKGFRWYVSDYKRFSSKNDERSWPVRFFPVLTERKSAAGSLGEYFWQDMFVAREIIKQNPKRHIDVGSRIDGFISHLACVRQVEIIDIRPLKTPIQNVSFIQSDITNCDQSSIGVADCVSCLHTLEHIGLGRYGDTLDPDGWKKGLKSLSTLLSSDGCLWLSVPVGIQRVEFNANRVFHPMTIFDEATCNGLALDTIYYLANNEIIESDNVERDFEKLGQKEYALAIFLFKKVQQELDKPIV